MSFQRLSSLGLHNPPLQRETVCKLHGKFSSMCYIGTAWTNCPTCTENEEAERKAREELIARDARLREWQRKVGQSGIPERFADRTLETYQAANEGQQHALMRASSFAQNIVQIPRFGGSLLMSGKPGTGKTHLACGIGLEVMQHGKSVLFTTVMRAFRRVRDSWDKKGETESAAIDALVFPDLLILDEVGVQAGSEWEKALMFDVLNERYEKSKPTIFLSNLPKAEIMAYLGERIFDRLREDGSEFVVFGWESYRRQKRD